MSYQIALNFEDGVTRFIDCKPAETVADAAYRQRINLPLDCRDGACGACKCSCESGSYVLGAYIDDAMSQAEAEAGQVLTCQMRATSDCVIRVPASSEVCKVKQAAFDTTISAVRQLSDSTFALTVRGEGLDKLAFLPGQYANVQVPGSEQQRAYSFSSMPRDQSVSFLIRNVPGGLMSGFLRETARPGAALRLTGPLGSFYLREIRRPVLMLAGGTGLAPFLAMLDKLAADGACAHPIHLIYGVNTDTDLVELERLNAYVADLPNFSYAPVVVSQDSGQPKKGYVTQHIEPAQLNDGDVDIYLCGPPAMVEAVSLYLRTHDVRPAGFYYEKFAASV